MRVLVTGSAGFVGSHVLQLLAARTNWGVTTFDNQGDPYRRLYDNLPQDVIISLAATADPREALRDPVAAYENNMRVMVDTLEHARRVGARVLHVSTNEVYGPGSTLPYRPRGPYAGAKACQEIICETYQDVPTTIVVTQSLFGERQQSDKLIPTAIRALLNDEPITLQRNGTRWASRPFLHVRNLAEALIELASVATPPGRVHVGAPVAVPLPYVVRILATTLGREARIAAVQCGDRAGHELVAAPIGCDVPNWRPTYPLHEALRDVALNVPVPA